MYLDKRSNILLKEILRNPNINNGMLQEKFNLTRRQIDYSFQKVNSWLEDKSYPKIYRGANGHFILDGNLYQLLGGTTEREEKDQYILTDRERANFIIIMLATCSKELSLNNFIRELGVSKNTVLRDLKTAKEILGKYELKVKYSRMNGYIMEGDEWNQRAALISTMKMIIESYHGEEFLQQIMRVDEATIRNLREKLERIEVYLGLQFIDSKIKILPYILEAIFRRIEKQKVITKSFFIDYSELSDTREYGAVEILIDDKLSISKEERMYITLQILTSNVIMKRYTKEEETSRLKLALEQMLIQFEQKACIQLIDRYKLIDKLFAHMKPAYYRIKYHLTLEHNSVLEKVMQEFQATHYLLKESLTPLENFIGTIIPEDESVFITLLISAHLIETKRQLQTKTKAVIVCPNGISISKLLEKTLRSLFPEIFFYQAMSIREFEKTNVAYDIVFSSVPLNTVKKLFIIHQVMDAQERQELRVRVLSSIHLVDERQISINGIIKRISPYVEIKNQSKLEKVLADYLMPNSPDEIQTEPEGEKTLCDLLTPERIIRVDHVSSWTEAIRLASVPLIEHGVITEGYVEEMQRQYPIAAEHIILGRTIAIPHAETEKGVKSLGMAMLFIEEGIPLEDGTKLNFVVTLAAVDKKAHFQALLQLMGLSREKEELNKLVKAENSKEMHEILKKIIPHYIEKTSN